MGKGIVFHGLTMQSIEIAASILLFFLPVVLIDHWFATRKGPLMPKLGIVVSMLAGLAELVLAVNFQLIHLSAA